ncbi:hypothetical protein [Natronomonas sp. LN261]|jgi:hypothetical protein|uniref:hypothetical protein n=1 Tax=Natronomonas sp. LN261 TaxID=2750669 RepID=UPI0015EE6F3C|nr:hypothetical protein [Natronomonas sp. LN261]
MYDRHFDEKGTYTTEDVLERAYALGVASVCGAPDEEAYDRLRRNCPDAYDETIIELAHDEGRANALDLEAEEDHEDIWEHLVGSDGAEPERGAGSDGAVSDRALPDVLRPPTEGDSDEGPPERLDLPSFLRR